MREKGKRYLFLRDKVFLLDKEETDMAHRQMEVYKGKKAPPHTHVRVSWFVLIGRIH